MANERKIIAVMGATGAQGGGLVRAILDDPASGFLPRAITRDASSDAARRLADLGAEVVEADAGDLPSLENAFLGARGAFCVTFFWEHFSPETELQHARNQAQAARSEGVGHVVWSTLEDTRRLVPLDDPRLPTLMERYKVPHFDAKGEADAFFTATDLPLTLLRTSFYWDNLINFGMGPQTGDDGTLRFTLPMGDAKLPGIAAEDIGRCAYGIFRAGNAYAGQTLGIAGEMLTGAEMAERLAHTLGQPVVHHAMDPADYRQLDFPGAADLGNMFQFKRDFAPEYCGARSVDVARQLNPELQDFATWLARNRNRMPLEAAGGEG